MSDIGVYTPETAKLVLEVVRYLKANGFVIEPGGRKPQFVPPDAPVYIRNDSGLVVPPFACCQVTGTVDVGGQNYLTIDQPADVTGEGGWYVFNGIAEIEAAADSYGIAYDGPLVRMLTDGSPITAGDRWQPMVNAWTVEPGGSLFIAAGADDIEANVMRAFVASVGGSGRFYKLIEDSHPTNGLIQKYAVRVGSPAGESPETTPILVVPWLLAPVLAGHIGWYMQHDGKWYFIQGDCPAECPNDGVLTVGTAPNGTVGEAYSHAVSGSGLTDGDLSSVGFEGLPPGLTGTDGAISGTPTEAGTFYVVVSATAPNSEDEEETCTLTRVLVIVIEEAEEEEEE